MGVKRISHWVGGKLVPGTSGRSGPVYDPATGVQTGEVDFASADEVGAAVDEAAAAFPAWRSASLSQRAEVLFRFRELVDRHRADLGAAITAEHGKVLSDAAGEVARGSKSSSSRVGSPTT